jgi:hypothetical protein
MAVASSRSSEADTQSEATLPPSYAEAVAARQPRRSRGRPPVESVVCANDGVNLTQTDIDRIRAMANEVLSDTSTVTGAAAESPNRRRFRRWRRKSQSSDSIPSPATPVIASTPREPPRNITSADATSLLGTYWVKLKSKLPPYRWGTPGTPDYETRRQKFLRNAQYVGMTVLYGLIFAVIVVSCVAILVVI